MILRHIEQICSVLDNYDNTITAIETGIIGSWGEMHTSTIATPANISAVIDAFLSHTVGLPILARKPKMIYDYLHTTLDEIDDFSIEKPTPLIGSAYTTTATWVRTPISEHTQIAKKK